MYVIQNWINGRAGGTPFSADRFNHMEAGILAASLVADAAVASVNGRTGAVVLTAADISSGNFPAGTFNFTGTLQEAGNRVYSAGNPPPYPVTSVATRTGAVVLTAADIGAGTFPGSYVVTGDLTEHGNIVSDNTKGHFFNMASGNQGYITGNGTNLLFRGGSTGLAVRNNADTATIMTVDNTGVVSFPGVLSAGGLSGSSNVVLITGGAGNHSIELGRMDGVSSTPFIDFHSGATAVDYDVRLIITGGTGVSGQGSLTTISDEWYWNYRGLGTQRIRFASDGSNQYIQSDMALVVSNIGSGTPRFKIDTTGYGLVANGLEVDVNGAGSASQALILRDTSTSQTKSFRVSANVLQILNNAFSSPIMTLDDSGNVTFTGSLSISPPTSTTAPTGGAAGALPANPVGYITVPIAGTNRKIPYYT